MTDAPISPTLSTRLRERGCGSVVPATLAMVLVLPLWSGCGGEDDGNGPVPPTPIESDARAPSGAISLGSEDLRPAAERPISVQLGLPPVSDDPTDPQNWRTTGPGDDPRRVEVGGLHSLKPASWTWQRPTVQFRTLQFTVPGRDGAEAADLIFSLFIGDDGGPMALNVDRWGNQFLDENGQGTAPLQNDWVDFEMPVNIVEHRGRYLAMGAAAPRADYAQIVGIVQAPGRRLFVRLTGPAGTVDANRGAFLDMLENLRPINHALPGDEPGAEAGDEEEDAASE